MRRLPSAGRPPRALVWLCALLYVLGGTFRNRSGVVLCVGEGTVQLTTAASAGGCACCAAIVAAPTADHDGCRDVCCSHRADAHGAATPSTRLPASPCDCVDVPLPFDRSDAPQHWHGEVDSSAPDDGAALLVSAPLPPEANAIAAPMTAPRPPPPRLSRQASPELRRYVVFLV